MNMNKTLLSAAMMAGLGIAAVTPQTALAVDGTITFNGTVTASSCTINSGTGSFAVTLPSVANTTLASSGATAGQTQFNIALTGCTAAATASTFFEQGANVNPVLGTLTSTGTAANVELQLMNSDGTTPINLLNTSTNTTSAAVTSAGGGTLSYYVRYYATGASTAGSVTATEQYTINYL